MEKHCAASTTTKTISTQLRDRWTDHHTLLLRKDAPPLQDEKAKKQQSQKPFKPAKCCELGICVCEDGPFFDAFHLWANMTRLMKPFMQRRRRKKGEAKEKKPPPPPARVLVEHADLVLKLDCLGLLDANNADDPDDEIQVDDWEALGHTNLAKQVLASNYASVEEFEEKAKSLLGSQGGQVSTFWYHLGYMNFKTWHFGFLPLDALRTYEINGECVQVLGVPTSPNAQRCFEAFQLLDLHRPILMSLHRIRSENRDLSPEEMRPNEIEVVAVTDSTFPRFRVWKGCEEERLAREAAKGSKPGGRKRQARRPPIQGKRQRGEAAAGPLPGSSSIPLGDLNNMQAEDHEDFAGEGYVDVDAGSDVSGSPPNSDLDSSCTEEEELDKELGEWLDYLDAEEAPEEFPDQHAETPKGQEHEGNDDDLDGHNVSADTKEQANRSEGGGNSGSDSSSSSNDSSSSSASSSDGALVPPRSRVVSGISEEIIKLGEFGEIRYNHNLEQFRAHCNNPAHEACRKTRTSRPGRSGQGRPLGFLMEWLRCAANIPDQKSHVGVNSISHSDRIAARQCFADFEGSDAFWRARRA